MVLAGRMGWLIVVVGVVVVGPVDKRVRAQVGVANEKRLLISILCMSF